MERTRPACWRCRLDIENFLLTRKAGPGGGDPLDGAPKAAREARALPEDSVRFFPERRAAAKLEILFLVITKR